MSHYSMSRPRLHSLIGDAMYDLPRDFAMKLERMLEIYGMPLPSAEDTVHLALERMKLEQATLPSIHRDAVTSALRMLVGLGATLEILQRAQKNLIEGADTWLGSPHLADGLLLASQGLAMSAERVLRGG